MPNINKGKFRETVSNFSGGQYSSAPSDSTDDPTGIGPNQVTLIQNGLINKEAHIDQRGGLTTFVTEAAAGLSDARVWALGVLDYSTTNKLFRVVSDAGATNGVTQVLDPTMDGWSNITGLTTMTQGQQAEIFQVGSKILVLNNGQDNIFSVTTGETAADLGSTAGSGHPPQAVAGTQHVGRAWVTDSNGDLYYSDALPALTAGANEWNQTDQSFTPKSPCVQPLPFKDDKLIVYGRNTIEFINTAGSPNEWGAQDIALDIGLASRRTAKNIGNDQVFLARDGFRLLSRTEFDAIRAGVISQNIQDVVDDINWDAIDVAWAEVIDNRYFCGLPVGTSTHANKVVVLDMFWFSKTGKPVWTVVGTDDWNLYSSAVFRISGVNTMVVGSAVTSGDRNVAKALTGNQDLGEDITLTINGKEHDGNDNSADKVWSHAFVKAGTGDFVNEIDVAYEVDAGGFVPTDPSSLSLSGGAAVPADDLYPANDLYPGGSNIASDIFWIKDRGVVMRPQIQHMTSDATATIFSYEVWGKVTNTKGG